MQLLNNNSINQIYYKIQYIFKLILILSGFMCLFVFGLNLTSSKKELWHFVFPKIFITGSLYISKLFKIYLEAIEIRQQFTAP